jgi:glutathione synthase
MDPLETVNVHKDTTYALMLGAARRGHKVLYLAPGGISAAESGLSFSVTEVQPQTDEGTPFVIVGNDEIMADAVDAVFIRPDPPFNSRYLTDTWLLDHVPPHVVVINEPGGLRSVNEKLWTLGFKEFIPPTLVTRSCKKFLEFLAAHNEVVIKPTDGCGGAGVFRLSHGDSNARVAFEVLSEDGGKEVIAQKYVPEAAVGDKRILLLNGDVLGAVLRVHSEDDHRNNFFAGGKPVATDVTGRDMEIVDALRPHLRELGLHFVGIDILGDYLIEVNVTSPTCLQEINRLNGARLEDEVIDYVEGLVEKKRTTA